MPRIKRKVLKFDEESVNSLLQECYNDSHNFKAKITNLFNKWEKFAKEGGEIAILGEQIVKVMQVEAKNQDQKLLLLKFLKEVVFRANEKDKKEDDANATISEDRRSALIKMVKEKMDAKD